MYRHRLCIIASAHGAQIAQSKTCRHTHTISHAHVHRSIVCVCSKISQGPMIVHTRACILQWLLFLRSGFGVSLCYSEDGGLPNARTLRDRRSWTICGQQVCSACFIEVVGISRHRLGQMKKWVIAGCAIDKVGNLMLGTATSNHDLS
jgi:hypothetical protein